MTLVLSSFTTSLLLLLCYTAVFSEGLKRCFKCRSRGDRGSCKDPFRYSNSTDLEKGVETVPCASGWCGKVLEGGANSFKDEEYGMATERTCLVRGPSDSEERCAPTVRSNTKVMMCFCQGDLCNAAPVSSVSALLMSLAPSLLLLRWSKYCVVSKFLKILQLTPYVQVSCSRINLLTYKSCFLSLKCKLDVYITLLLFDDSWIITILNWFKYIQ